MASTQSLCETQAVDLARECLYRFLAAALGEPGGAGWSLVLDPPGRRLAQEAAELLREEALAAPQPLGLGELPPDYCRLEPLLEQLLRPADDLQAEYDRVFGLVPTPECPPYETEYHASGETFFRSQQLADVAGFYRAFGLEPAHAVPERPDHLALELEFMAFLLMKKRLTGSEAGATERAEVCDQAQRTFFQEHLAWWVPAFATGLRRKAGSGLYSALAQVLASLVAAERWRLGIPAPRLPVQATLIERPEEQAGCAACSTAI
jgi:DMSO reductase family type II enzyme chaperone